MKNTVERRFFPDLWELRTYLSQKSGYGEKRDDLTEAIMDELLEWRKEFPILDKTVYMINHSLGAMPRRTRDRLNEYAEIWATQRNPRLGGRLVDDAEDRRRHRWQDHRRGRRAKW